MPAFNYKERLAALTIRKLFEHFLGRNDESFPIKWNYLSEQDLLVTHNKQFVRNLKAHS